MLSGSYTGIARERHWTHWDSRTEQSKTASQRQSELSSSRQGKKRFNIIHRPTQ
jgi:hypothetical protein